MEQLSAQLTHIAEYILLLAPEIMLAVGFVLCILADIFFPQAKAAWPSVLVLFLALLGAAYCLYTPFVPWQSQAVLEGMLWADTFSVFFRSLIIGAGFLALGQWLLSAEARKGAGRGEQLALLLAALLGLEMMVLAGNFLLLYLGIELVSVAAYILMIFRFSPKAAAASIKYLLFGALSSGLMLYGISFFYGLSGTLSFAQSGFIEAIAQAEPFLVFLALLLVLAGLLFKVSAVPFHVWSPEVYQHAPTHWLGFFSVAPKIAGVAVLWRFSQIFQDFTFAPVEGWTFSWAALLAVLALASILLGNLAALSQQNAKAMMAFSGIAQAGFMLILVALGSAFALQGLRAYLGVYMLMNFLAFTLIQTVETYQQEATMQEYTGLGKVQPLWGILFLIVMLSLVGLPPLAGFMTKLLLFSALWEAYSLQGQAFWLWLFVIGLLNTAVGLFYYLKIPYYWFFGQSESHLPLKISKAQYWYCGILAALLLVFFVKIDWWF